MDHASGNSCEPRRLTREVAIVTGGAQGIGKAIARRLLSEGAAVAILDVNDEVGSESAKELSVTGRAMFMRCDVRNRGEVRDAIGGIEGAYGPVTALVNNAGIGRRARFLDLDDDAWNEVIGVNLTGAFVVGQEVCRGMARSGRGSVVNMGSISAYLANSELTPYSVSKAGLLGLTRMMAFELAPAGIRVNAVAPGTIATDFVGRMLTAEAQAERERRIPMARFGTPDEVASTVAFLVSEDARYVTGTTILIDGGLVSAGIRSGQA